MSTLHKRASVVFVICVFTFTLVVCVVLCVYSTAHLANKRSRSAGPLTGLAAALLHFIVLYPQVFVAVDMVDLNLCPNEEVIFTDTGNGCYIPVTIMWIVLKGMNLAYTIFFAPFAVCWISNRHRSFFKRLLISSTSAFCVLLVAAAVVIIPYVASGSGRNSMVGTLLVADSQPFQVDNITNSDCYTDPTADLDSQHQEWLAFEDSVINVDNACSWADTLESLISNNFVAVNTFYSYVMSLYSVLAVPVYSVLVGIGFVAYPWDLLTMFIKRPRRPIGKSEFIQRGRALIGEAKKIQLLDAQLMHEMEGFSSWLSGQRILRSRRHKLNRRLAVLEAANYRLSQLYPEGEERELVWTFQVMWNWCHLVRGVFAVIFSLLWILNMILFQLPSVPISPWLNAMIVINPGNSFGAYLQNMSVFIFVALLLFHLFECTFSGLRTCQNTFKFLTIHEYRPHSTQLSSFLINCWWLAGVANAKLYMISFNLSGALFGTSLLDVTVQETAVIERQLLLPPQTHATVLACLFFTVIATTLTLKVAISMSSPASHFMTWLKKYVDLSLPIYDL